MMIIIGLIVLTVCDSGLDMAAWERACEFGREACERYRVDFVAAVS